jgi:erlin
VSCGTSGGVTVMFEQIEVVNRLNKALAQETVKNYTVTYDKTWIFDKIQ